MTGPRHSLLAGRNQQPLSPEDVRRVSNTFLGMEPTVNARYDSSISTIFHVIVDGAGQEYGEVVFGCDIYPGRSVIDPNSALSLDAAAAHELAHFHRWRNKSGLPEDHLAQIDEALTSLEAILRYERHLRDNDMRQLVRDAIQRIQLYLGEQTT